MNYIIFTLYLRDTHLIDGTVFMVIRSCLWSDGWGLVLQLGLGVGLGLGSGNGFHSFLFVFSRFFFFPSI